MNIFVMLPTFNEAGNIEKIIDAILFNVPSAKILVVDDNSPDGTADIVKLKAKSYPQQVFLLLRTEEKGRGSAGRDGFKYVLDKGADVVIEMDADLSHDPKYLPQMLKEIAEYDVILGSRFVPGGEDNRGLVRNILTTLGNFCFRMILGLKIRDCTSGYRVFRAEVLKKINLDKLMSPGPSIVEEILYKTYIYGFNIKEVPIVFVDRTKGNSKFNFKTIVEVLLMVLVFKVVFSSVWRKEV